MGDNSTGMGGLQSPNPASDRVAAASFDSTPGARQHMVQTMVTCPFLGPAVAMQRLAVQAGFSSPLADIEELRALGNSGGGDLGDLLVVFASGNHLAMRDAAGALSTRVPVGLFSLELPGSQGSHFGHSGILQGNPKTPGSGRLSMEDFARLCAAARDGLVRRTDVGRFIAQNLQRDPNSQVFGPSTAMLFLADLHSFVTAIGPAVMARLGATNAHAVEAHRDVEQKLTKLLGDDHLVASAGEFGLLFAFFANRPGAPKRDGEPALSVTDLASMFVHKELPQGWETWRKSKADWVLNTTALAIAAGREYLTLQRKLA